MAGYNDDEEDLEGVGVDGSEETAEENNEQDEEQQAQEQQKEQNRIQERILKNKLMKIRAKVLRNKMMMWLGPVDLKVMKQAKKNKNLKMEATIIEGILMMNRASNASKLISASPALYYLFFGALIVFLVVCVVVIIASMMPWLFPDDDLSGLTNPNGIKGADFYGARVVYTDDELATQSFVEDCVDLIEVGVETAKTTTLTNAKLVLNLEMPSEEYNYLELATTHQVVYNAVFDIAKIVYKVDNGAEFTSSSLQDCAKGIRYFGFVKVDENNNGVDDITEVVQNTILNNSTFEKLTQEQDELTTTDIETSQGSIKTSIATALSVEKYNLRTEKLFVKDVIINGDENGIARLEKNNYVTFIFMPKKNVTFTKVSFVVGAENLNNFEIVLNNEGNEIGLKKDESNMGNETMQSYMYETGLLFSQSVNSFTDIDINNLNALSAGLSLFDIVENDLTYSTYLENKTENSVEFLTIKKNGLVANLSFDKEFNFGEAETKWN